MGMDDLYKVIGMFQQGVKEFGVRSAFSQARDQMNQINMSAMKDEEKRAAQQQLANQMALQLGAAGASASDMQMGLLATQPKQFGSIAEVGLEGQLTGNKQLQDIYNKSMAQGASAARSNRLFEHQLDLQKIAYENAYKLQLEASKGQSAKNLGETELAQLDFLDQSEEQLTRANQMFANLDKLTTVPRTGLGSISEFLVKGLGEATDSESYKARQQFESEVSSLESDILHKLSGAAVSPEEIERIRRGIPNMQDKPVAFKAKLEATLERVRAARSRKLKNFEMAGRNVGQFMQANQQRQEEVIQVQNKLNKLKRFNP